MGVRTSRLAADSEVVRSRTPPADLLARWQALAQRRRHASPACLSSQGEPVRRWRHTTPGVGGTPSPTGLLQPDAGCRDGTPERETH